MLRCRREVGDEARVLATGGDAPLIVPYCEEVDEMVEDLTLRGILLAYQKVSG